MDTRERIETRSPAARCMAPTRQYALLAGAFLVALGLLSVVSETVDFGTVGTAAQHPEFLSWTVNGWTAVFWMAMGAVGLLSTGTFESARAYALAAGAIFAVVAVWGFIDGNDVVGLLVADTMNNVTHAVLGALGLVAAAIPRAAQGPPEATEGADDVLDPGPGRFEQRSASNRMAGRR